MCVYIYDVYIHIYVFQEKNIYFFLIYIRKRLPDHISPFML